MYIYQDVSVIDGTKNELVAGVIFSIHPADSGHIKCNNMETPTNHTSTYGFTQNA
jgi:hypothetical protein